MADYTIEPSADVFEIRVKGKKTYRLPAWEHLPASVGLRAERARRKDGDAGAGLALWEYVDEKCPGLLDCVDQSQLVEIAEAWRGGGVELGE